MTIPAGVKVGDVLVILLSLNNTDNFSAAPSGLSLVDNNTSVSTFPGRLYVGTIDGATLAASGTLTWTLGATRGWSVALYAATGINGTNPVNSFWVAGSNATDIVIPTGTTGISTWIIEAASGLSNGAAITSWTPPTDWVVRATAPANSGTAGSSFVAERTPGTAAQQSTYGGDTYLADNASSAAVRYLIALNQLQVQNNFEGGSNTTSITTANAGGSGNTQFDSIFTGAGSLTFDSTYAAQGTLSMNATQSSNSTVYAAYETSFGTQTSFYGRFYAYLTAYPSLSVYLFSATQLPSTVAWNCGITTAGKVRSSTPAGTNMTVSTATVPLNQWFRVEFYIFLSSSTSQSITRYYSDPSSMTADETNTSTATYTTADYADRFRFGSITSTSTTYSLNLDSIALASSDWIGITDLNTGQFPWFRA